jgi:E3 ubiquitin-protein ligase HUWE1
MSLGEAGASTPGAAAAGDGTLPFLKFAERHRRLLNAYIRRNTSLLESSLAPLLRVPKLIDFDNKRAYFR